MLLSELLGVKKFKNMTRNEIADFADKSGSFKQLGRGGFAHALERNGIVYKFWIKDQAYESYVKYCLKNQDCKFVPKLYSGIKELPAIFTKVVHMPDKVKYVKMEKLEPYKKTEVKLFSNDKLPTIEFTELFYCIRRNRDEVEEAIKHFLKVDQKEKIDEKDAIDLVYLLVDLQKLINPEDTGIDNHDGNFAMRGNTPVVLDPIFSSSDGELNRFWRGLESDLTMKKFMDSLKRAAEAKQNEK